MKWVGERPNSMGQERTTSGLNRGTVDQCRLKKYLYIQAKKVSLAPGAMLQ